MNTQEENWKLMHMLNMPYDKCNQLEGDDRSFLLERSEKIRKKMEAEADAAKGQGAQNVVAPSDLDITE